MTRFWSSDGRESMPFLQLTQTGDQEATGVLIAKDRRVRSRFSADGVTAMVPLGAHRLMATAVKTRFS